MIHSSSSSSSSSLWSLSSLDEDEDDDAEEEKQKNKFRCYYASKITQSNTQNSYEESISTITS